MLSSLRSSAAGRLWLIVLCALLAPAPARSNGAADAPVHDPAARLPGGKASSEYWDVTARFDSGHRMFARFMITNIGPGERNAVAIGHMVLPNGRVDRFGNGGIGGRWKLASDGLRLDVKNSHLDLHPPVWRLFIDKPSTRYDLRIAPRGHPSTPAGLAPDGYRFELLDAAAPIEGTLWHERKLPEEIAVRGVAALSHTWTEEAEAKLVRRRIEFFSLHEDGAVQLTDLTRPSGERVRWLTLADAAGNVLTSSNFELELRGLSSDGAPGCYPVPSELRLAGPRVTGRVGLDHTLLRDDPFERLPQPFRYFAYREMRPHRVWETAPFELTLHPAPDGDPLSLRGTGVAVVNFTKPLKGACD